MRLTRKLGFTLAVQQEKLSEVMDTAEGADACIGCKGTSEALAECVRCVRADGTVVCVGAPAGDVSFFRTIIWEYSRRSLCWWECRLLIPGIWKNGQRL